MTRLTQHWILHATAWTYQYSEQIHWWDSGGIVMGYCYGSNYFLIGFDIWWCKFNQKPVAEEFGDSNEEDYVVWINSQDVYHKLLSNDLSLLPHVRAGVLTVG